MIRAFQCTATVTRETGSAQPNAIETTDARRISIRREKRQDVLNNLGFATDHRVPSHPYELMRSYIV